MMNALAANLRFACTLLMCAVFVFTGPSSTKAEGDASDAVAFERTLRPFLKSYCVRCHGPEEQNAERRFDALAAEIEDSNALVDFQDILDQLNLGAMPPEDEKQPSDDERRAVVEWLTGRIAKYHEEHQPTHDQTVLRRLNSREYSNTVRDLLHLNMTMFDPTAAFPRDQMTEHLDNVGEALVTSGYLLDCYLDAAEQSIGKAAWPLERPPVQTWTFHDNFRQQPEIDQIGRYTQNHYFDYIKLYDVVGADKHEGAYGMINEFRQGVPYDGFYEMTFTAAAVNRIHPYDPEFLGLDPSEPLRLGIRPGNSRVGPLHHTQPIEPLLTELDLTDEPETYTVRIWLDRGYTPRFTFQNGLMDARSLWTRVIREYPEQFPGLNGRGIVVMRKTAIMDGKLPQIRIDDIEIRGPLYDEWPRPSQQAVFGRDVDRFAAADLRSDVSAPGTSSSEDDLRQQLAEFATRAYRRPARNDEVERLVELIGTRRAEGATMAEAWTDALKAVMCSPGFLYLNNDADDGRLTSYALASRLSYFLWSSMPDDELMALADQGMLQDTAVLEAQVERMLSDPRSEAFVDGFLDSWLTLRDLGSMPPDRGDFEEYYHYDLGAAMRQETHLFTRHLLDENLSIVNFLDSDFTFVNKPLARHYGVELPEGPGFERVALHDRRRGGLLGQAAIATVTANGIDTSPVIRGVWLLENILGTPPSPPPPDVEPLDPDVRGAVTIRDQLEKHRSNASCNDCHRKIDPLGFAMENFDAIGAWREKYDRVNEIDSAGELPGGVAFDDVVGMKKVLVERKGLFARALATKLLAYGMGRQTEPADRPHLDALLSEAESQGYGFRDLIKQVVVSEPFRSP